MKPLNSAERKAHRQKFIAIYCISVVLIIIVLCGFLQPAPAIKTIVVEKEKPARVIIKKVYATKQSADENNFHERDSLIAAISFNEKKVDELNLYIQSQKNIITKLQNTNRPMANNVPNKNEWQNLKSKSNFMIGR